MNKLLVCVLFMSLCYGADDTHLWEKIIWEQATASFNNIHEETRINIHKKRICSIPDTVKLPNLLSLCTTYNKMTSFGTPTLENLQWLNINCNRIKTIDNIDLPKLEVLFARHNLITHLDSINILKNFPHLVFIDLSYNPISWAYVYDLEFHATRQGRKIKIIVDHLKNDGKNIKKARAK